MNFQNDNSIDIKSDKSIIDTNGEDNRCLWCNNESFEDNVLLQRELLKKGKDEPAYFWTCSDEHDQKIRKYFSFVDKVYFLYLIFIFLFPLILIGLTIIFRNLYYLFGAFISLGVGLTILPLMGNQLMYNLGIKRTNTLGRILGGMLILIGLAAIVINGFNLIF